MEKLGDQELRHRWRTAHTLHQNFYENWMSQREAEFSVKDIKSFLEKRRKVTSI